MERRPIPEVVRQSLSPDFAMGWDFFLALVPLGLALLLFRRQPRRGPLWWAGVALFVLFLPNAPYPLTDVLHFVLKVRQRPHLPAWAVGLLVVPQYLLYIGSSFLAYVVSLHLLGDSLRRAGRPRAVAAVEVTLHGLCAVGIYLGRVLRLNSWDALMRPKTVLLDAAGAIDRGRSVLFIAGTAAVIATAYYPVRHLLVAVRGLRHEDPSREELLGLLSRSGYEMGRARDGRLFLRRKGLDWPPSGGEPKAGPGSFA